jgi:hypothetical protein
MSESEIAIFTSAALVELVALAPAANSKQEAYGLIDLAASIPSQTIRARATLVGDAPPDIAQMARDGEHQGAIARALHVWLGPLSAVAGSDHRLWSYLASVTFREYMEARWPLDKSPVNGRLLERWLMPRPTRESLARNGISRLWWAAHLTHDPKLQRPRSRATSDPYAYTSEILQKEDRFVGIVEREAGSIPNVVYPLLDHLSETDTPDSEKYVRDLLKEITLIGGYSDLGSLSEQETRNRIQEIVSFRAMQSSN